MNTKWFHFASSALVTIFGSLAIMDWSSVMSAGTAAKVVVGLGALKMIISTLTQPTV